MNPKPAVLVNVDDNEPARYARSRMLRKSGFEVHEAGSAAKTFELLASVSPDLVLLDVNLPDMNGIDVCRTIKSDQGASVLVLQISASAISAPQATASLNNGADCYLVEPVDADVLVATVRALLRLRQAERDLAQTNTALVEANRKLTELNNALKRSNDDLEHFAYVASHDLQEPLRTVTTHVQLLDRAMGARLNESERELFGFVVDASRRMSALIEDVLTYSRAGRSTPVFGIVSLDDALVWALKNLAQSIHNTGGEVISDGLPKVWGDGVQLAQVFQNLIGNSLKYRSATAAPRIVVMAKRTADDELQVTVSDNGIGIAPEFHERVFGPFKRLHGGEIPGTGIGLALCRRIVESHGGRIWVESNVGEGSTFRFTLKSQGVDGSA